MAICLWWGLGAMLAGKQPQTLPLGISGCPESNTTWSHENTSSPNMPAYSADFNSLGEVGYYTSPALTDGSR